MPGTIRGFSWYLTGSPHPVLKISGYSLPFLHLAAMLFTRLKIRWAAWLLLLPHAFLVVYFMGLGVLLRDLWLK